MKPSISISEEHGLAALPKGALSIYSVGISTAGAAEVRMAEANPKRHIIASTIDKQGVAESQKKVEQQGLSDRIEVKLEDAAQKLSYTDDTFDYVYARLVLHYLTKQQLSATLAELHRVLKPDGTIFIVVRSTKNIDANERATGYDEHTGLTTFITRPNTALAEERKRFFHSPESIAHYVQEAGFIITHNEQYDEHLYHDYGRTILAEHSNNLVEVVARKSSL
jgi:ubiquinone/menaquinone biosynthesis C-methylase UbiE